MGEAILRTAAVVALGAASLCGGAALAEGAARLALSDRVEAGLWEIRVRGGAVERICLADVRRLIQLRHPNAACRQFVVEDEARVATVQYVCTGQGTGRTQVRFESPRLLQIDSQGIASKAPFELSAEARRIGPCPAS